MRLPLIAALALLLIGVLADFLVTLTLRGFHKRKRVVAFYLGGSAFVQCLLVAVMLWPKRDADASLLPPMWMLFTWLSVYISKIVYLLLAGLGLLIQRISKIALPSRSIAFTLALTIFCLIWGGAIWGRRQSKIEEITVYSERLPGSFDGFRIVQFSDLHSGTWGNDTTYISSLVEQINSLRPDLIVFTGDAVNRQSAELRPFMPVLARLKAPYGVYSIMGNHDYADYSEWKDKKQKDSDVSALMGMERKMGWTLLNDTTVYLQAQVDSIALMGVQNWGEPPFKTYGSLRKAKDSRHDDGFAILLSHNPLHWRNEVRESEPIDLTLSGHTHAMQMRLRFPGKDLSLSSLKYPEWEGLHAYRQSSGRTSHLYVNIGCGEVGFPARIGARPEITLITLKKK